MIDRWSSIVKALAVAYPDYPWQQSRFVRPAFGRKVPHGYWKDRERLQAAELKLGIEKV